MDFVLRESDGGGEFFSRVQEKNKIVLKGSKAETLTGGSTGLDIEFLDCLSGFLPRHPSAAAST